MRIMAAPAELAGQVLHSYIGLFDCKTVSRVSTLMGNKRRRTIKQSYDSFTEIEFGTVKRDLI